MSGLKNIELYRILKSANPDGDFSGYEAAIRESESKRLSSCIASLNLPSAQAQRFSFFEPKTKDVLTLHIETDEYISALRELERECRDCVDRKVDLGNLGNVVRGEHDKINLSSTREVEKAINRLRTAKGLSGGGIYFQSNFPLLIFLKPAADSGNKDYAKKFNKHIDDFIEARKVSHDDVKKFFQDEGYTYVSESTVRYVAAEANKELTAAITRYTRSSSGRLAWSMLWRMLVLFVVLAVPTLALSLLDIRLPGFEWYWWIFYILMGLGAGIVSPFIIYSIKTQAYRIKEKFEIRMFLLPFIISCVLLAAVIAVVAIHNGLLSIIFGAIYFVLYVVGTQVRYHINKGNDCNKDNTWGIKTILNGLFVALFSFCFGNLLLDNQAAFLTVNILAALGCISTICAGSAFAEFLEDVVEDDFSTVMAFFLPIATFLIGQVVQCTLYDAGYDIPIIGNIFGQIPLLFMVLSFICCGMCTALVCINNMCLLDNGMTVRAWIFNIICSACFMLIPCFSGAGGVVVLPFITFILARRYYNDVESFWGLGITTLIVLFVLGQFVQYYFHVVETSTLPLALLFARIPLWIKIISTIAGAVSIGLTIHCYYDYEIEDGIFCLVPGIMLGVLPSVTGIPFLIVTIIASAQFSNSTYDEYMPIAPMIAAFGVGQALFWWNYKDTGQIFLLSNLLKAFGVVEPIGVAFPIISTVFGVAACVLAIIVTYWLFEDNENLRGLWVMIPFVSLMFASPALASIPMFVVVLLVMIFHRREPQTHNYNSWSPRKKKPKKRFLYLGMGIAVGLQVLVYAMSFIDFTHIGLYSDNGVYYEMRDGQYYVTDCAENKELLILPKKIKGRDVAGLTDEFAKNHPHYLYNLNYDHADANDGAGKVVVLNSNTKEKFPVPKREGYTFYGWWTSPNRNKGYGITDGEGGINKYAQLGDYTDLYAMWFGSEYRFISSYYELYDIEYSLSSKYVLMNDITIEGNYTPICGLPGMETQSYRRAFNGTLDGNYHTVKYSITGSRRYNGLFSWIGASGTVKNLGVDADIDVCFLSESKDYYAFAGGIAAINDGVIENCWCTGSIKLENKISVAFAAGIAGASGTNNMRTGAITGCYNLAQIESRADDSYAAGILGSAENDGQTVSYCYNRGTIKATGINSNNTAAGGIISHGRTHAENCYNAGAILTDYVNKQTLGGILGFIRNTSAHNCPPKNCAWLKASGCQATWGVGKYSDDETGGNNGGVTVVKKEDANLANLLNAGKKYFTVSDGKLRLAWERYL